MFYLKFVQNGGSMFNTSCDSYETTPKDGGDWLWIRTLHKQGTKDRYEDRFIVCPEDAQCVSEGIVYRAVSCFVMNAEGRTIDKHVFAKYPKSQADLAAERIGIVINGIPIRCVPGEDTLTYEVICQMAGKDRDSLYIVDYTNHQDHGGMTGKVAVDGFVKITEGMDFAVFPAHDALVDSENKDWTTVIINDRAHEIDKAITTLSYRKICTLANKNSDILHTVTFSKGPVNWAEDGSLLPGQNVRIVQGMIFNVHDTSNA